MTFKSSLAQIKGMLHAANTCRTDVTDRSGHNSKKYELIIYINGRRLKFYFAKNIGDERHAEKYEKFYKS